MDGYAVRAADLAGGEENRLDVVGTAYAGGAFSGLVGPGQAVRVMTGAVLPPGADTVVVQEATRVEGGAVILPAGQQAGPERAPRRRGPGARRRRWPPASGSARPNWG